MYIHIFKYKTVSVNTSNRPCSTGVHENWRLHGGFGVACDSFRELVTDPDQCRFLNTDQRKLAGNVCDVLKLKCRNLTQKAYLKK